MLGCGVCETVVGVTWAFIKGAAGFSPLRGVWTKYIGASTGKLLEKRMLAYCAENGWAPPQASRLPTA
jgi:hypothetical protein